MNQRIVLFTLYSIVYQMLCIAGAGYVVFGLGHSGWWMALGAILSSNQMGPSSFGITSYNADDED